MARSQKQRLREQRRREEARTAEMKARQRAGQHRNEPPKDKLKREPQERFIVDSDRTWHVVRTLPRWSARAAEQVRAVGIPVFEAREAQRLVSEIGKARVALVPILRRLLFVGTAGWQELQKVETHPGIYDDATGYRRSGVAIHDGRVMTIAPDELQVFADCVTGWSEEVNQALRILFAIGETIRVADGPFASFSGTVEEIDANRSRMKVAVDIFGRATPVELGFEQVARGSVSI